MKTCAGLDASEIICSRRYRFADLAYSFTTNHLAWVPAIATKVVAHGGGQADVAVGLAECDLLGQQGNHASTGFEH